MDAHQQSEPPNAILRGGSQDGQRTHLGRGAEPLTYRPGNGEQYRATNTWEDQLRVYRCVARAGLVTLRAPSPVLATRLGAALGMSESPVSHRARALLAPPQRTRPVLLAVVLAVVLVTSFATVRLAHLTEHRYEQAHAAYLQR